MKESDENAGELFRMEEIYQLGKFPFEEENLVVRAERRLGRRLKRENQKDVYKRQIHFCVLASSKLLLPSLI